MQTFQDLVRTFKHEKGWSNVEFATVAGVSNRAIVEATSGKTDRLVQTGGVQTRKLLGVADSTQRLLRVIGVDAKPWLEQLGLSDYARTISSTPRASIGKISNFQFLMDEAITSEDLNLLCEAQKGLGEVFTLEIALKVLANAKS